MKSEEIYKLLIERGFLNDAEKLYGMNIEPRGREIHFALKGICGKEWDTAYASYSQYKQSNQYHDDWKEFKRKYNLK